jgi:hypothetical protein
MQADALLTFSAWHVQRRARSQLPETPAHLTFYVILDLFS